MTARRSVPARRPVTAQFVDDLGHQVTDSLQCFLPRFAQPGKGGELHTGADELFVLGRPNHAVAVVVSSVAGILAAMRANPRNVRYEDLAKWARTTFDPRMNIQTTRQEGGKPMTAVTLPDVTHPARRFEHRARPGSRSAGPPR